MKETLILSLACLLYCVSLSAEQSWPDDDQSAEAFAREIINAGRERYRQEQAEKRKVVMFATSWCSYCRMARTYFKNHGIDYTEYDIEKNRAARLEYERLNGRGVPLIVVGEQLMRGFSADRFNSMYRAIQ